MATLTPLVALTALTAPLAGYASRAYNDSRPNASRPDGSSVAPEGFPPLDGLLTDAHVQALRAGSGLKKDPVPFLANSPASTS